MCLMLQINFQGGIVGFSSLLSTVFMVISSTFPLFVMIFLLRNKKRLNDKAFENKYGSLYEGLNTESSHYSLY